MLWPSNFRASHSNWKRSRNRPSKGFGIHSNRRKPRYRIWIEHSYFATFLRATNQIHWLRLLEMLYLKMTFQWGVNESRYRNPSTSNAQKPNFSILQAVITRLKRAKGGDKIWWVRTGAPIARDQYRWMHDGKASCWPAGFKELFFVFPAPHSYWYWLCFPSLLCHILYSVCKVLVLLHFYSEFHWLRIAFLRFQKSTFFGMFMSFTGSVTTETFL